MAYKPTGIKKLFHNTRRRLAKKWISVMPALQIGITGSQGKTNTTHLITKLCQDLDPTVTTDLTLDTVYNVPITALKIMPWTKYVVWELGIDKIGEMDYHLQIARPSIGVVTGISPVHTDAEHLKSLENLIQEKQKLIKFLPKNGTAILNHDDKHVREMAKQSDAKVKWFGSSKTCDIWVDPKSVNVTLEGTKATFYYKNEPFTVKTGLIGTHHVQTMMIGFLVLETISNRFLIERFTDVVKSVKPLKGRLSVEKGPLNTVLLNDSLRANPESTRAGLETLDRIQYNKGRKIVVIGEMGELENPEEEHSKTGKQIAKLNLDFVLCIGPLRQYTINEAIKHGYPKNKIAYAKDVFEAADILKSILKKDDLWYLKGSLLRNYKRIVQLLNGERVCCDAILCPYEHCGYDMV